MRERTKMAGTNGTSPEMVNLTIDGKPVSVPKGTNIIKAAAAAGVEIPHYCYHPHLSVPGNCRMCQVKVAGQPKLSIGCHMTVTEGMAVQTHLSSKEVEDAQAATLEMILINHPLDCTVCDQAGHCKLQDYHFEYNAKPSRFIEEKVHKVKAEPLGPHVILDGERCIMCTRCIRFCDEVTKTNELGMINRGDRSMIAINPKKPLDNALSGTVVDLCPVGALTHRDWRFNTRIWFTKHTAAICPGCSTGCNVKVYERDGEIVQVKARMNDQVNKEWLCDEGRYGFGRFLPKKRFIAPRVNFKEASWELAVNEAQKLKNSPTLVLLSPDLLLEEYALIKQLIDRVLKDAQVGVAYRGRKLTEVESVLISPDYASNYKAAEYAGLVNGDLEKSYGDALSKLRSAAFKNVLIVGDRAVLAQDQDDGVLAGLSKFEVSIALLADAASPLASASKVVLPTRTIIEKAGLMINRNMRLQYTDQVLDFPVGAEPEWRSLNRISEKMGAKLIQAQNDRELTLGYLATTPALSMLNIKRIKAGGVDLKNIATSQAQTHSEAEWR